MFWMFYAFFWVIPRRLNFKCRRFGTLCLFRLHRQVGASRDPSQLVSVLWTAPNLSPSVLMAQANSETNLFPYNTPNMPLADFILHTPTCIWRWNRQCSETSAFKIQTPGNNPKESIQHSEHGKSLKSKIRTLLFYNLLWDRTKLKYKK